MTDTKNFIEGAKGLAKNPLGIIALFIALIYGFATLLLGITASGLQPQERRPLIWFVVLFPVVVLIAFFRLVTKHHGKLYSPSDYGNDESFLRTLPLDEQQARIDEEVASIEVHPQPDQPSVPIVRGELVAGMPQIQSSSHGSVIDRQTSREQYMLAESLAIQKLSKDSGLLFKPQVSFGQGRTAAFDAVAQDKETFTAVEVKFIKRSMVPPSIFREALYRAVVASDIVTKRSENHTFKFILVVVADMVSQEDIDRMTRQVQSILMDAPVRVELKVFTLKELMHEFSIPTIA